MELLFEVYSLSVTKTNSSLVFIIFSIYHSQVSSIMQYFVWLVIRFVSAEFEWKKVLMGKKTLTGVGDFFYSHTSFSMMEFCIQSSRVVNA